jgi:hypothetical protein
MTPKFHWLTTHTVPFVKRFGTWGKLNEQAVESIHHQVNLDVAKLGNVRNQEVIFERLTNSCCIRNALFDQNIATFSAPVEEMVITDEEYLELITM